MALKKCYPIHLMMVTITIRPSETKTISPHWQIKAAEESWPLRSIELSERNRSRANNVSECSIVCRDSGFSVTHKEWTLTEWRKGVFSKRIAIITIPKWSLIGQMCVLFGK
ncbi:hypothetical protein AVEN_275266-1 [Araneus ventricosus]|uniref:Uncharacterized protein n=1 Tax=Araneus ventricosus TaxID=182803 RepID=A0A4Y2PZU2_ARAVE|nr:hypothetical protein AVEN_275266-1 [Araneus ventricosus]